MVTFTIFTTFIYKLDKSQIDKASKNPKCKEFFDGDLF